MRALQLAPRHLVAGVRRSLPASALLALALFSDRADAQRPAAGDQPSSARTVKDGEWLAYGRDDGGTRYSPLRAVDRTNVKKLELAWTYRTGDFLAAPHAARAEGTPLMVDGTLYLSTPFGRVIALDPASGAERWSFDPRVNLSGDYGDFANRGVSTWVDPSRPRAAPCRRRIFVAPIDARLIALDARTGARCADFATNGEIDLTKGILNAPSYKGEYQVTSPPAIVGDLVIVGSAIADNQRLDAPSGVVRAFDARSGALRWQWDPVPRTPDLAGYDSWRGANAHRTGAANAWSLISIDAERGLVFVPVGSASPDFFGGERLGANLYSNSVVALRAATGDVVWHFQVVHHDLWDYDVASQPVLFTLRREGRAIPALAQATKMGHLFILDRETGTPLFPVEERPVPRSDVAGEEAWPTQPFPVLPRPLVPASLTPDEAWGVNDADRRWCRDRIAGLRSEGIFTPPSLKGTLLFPGNVGGSNWSGAAIDTARGIVVVPSNRLGTVITLVPRASMTEHRRANRGSGSEISDQRGTAFGMQRDWLRAPSGAPCNAPPFGTLTAIELASGNVLWEKPLGSIPAFKDIPGSEHWGSINLGGAMITAGGLVFIAGTMDERLRAFDIDTGEELWSAPLPAGGNALPMTYTGDDGRQYIAISAGGHNGLGTRSGDYVIAWALPERRRVATAALPPLAGRYAGELISERRRIPATLELRESGGTITGELRATNPAFTIPVTVRRENDAIRLSATFSLATPVCTGVLEARAERANRGTMLVGTMEISGPCSGQAPDPGTLALRRQ